MAKSNKLTDKQEKFILELLKGKSQREAYKSAYPRCKATDNAIDVNACKLFNSTKVLLRYNELHDRLLKEAEDETIVTAKEVLKEIKSIAFDDIGNYLEYKTILHQVGETEDGTPIMKYDTVVILNDSKKINTKNISEVSKGRDGQFKFKTYCRDTALYKLADILRLGDKSDDSSDKAVQIIDDI